MTITEQIRLKLKTVDDKLSNVEKATNYREHGDLYFAFFETRAARRILREICELDESDDGEV